MIGNGQWVTTRDARSVELYEADIRLRARLRREQSRWWWENRRYGVSLLRRFFRSRA